MMAEGFEGSFLLTLLVFPISETNCEDKFYVVSLRLSLAS